MAACDIEGGDPVQHALRDASAARQAAALKTTEEEQAAAARRAASAPVAHAEGDELSRLIAAESFAGQEVLIHDPGEFQRRLAQRQQINLPLPFAL